MYRRILVALDGSQQSDLAMQAALHLAALGENLELIGCHVYAARLHEARFAQMEPGLPENYQTEEALCDLRGTHDDLITQGMHVISDAYLAPLARAARDSGLTWEGQTPEGRNYVELLRIIRDRNPDLITLGAFGQGHVPESALGSVTERVLLHADSCDVLTMRQPWSFRERPIVVGVDGSDSSFAALGRALQIAQACGASVIAVAVYDPFFHNTVFRTIAQALPEAQRDRFDFPAQEQLHNEIIDKGLENLYAEGLRQGTRLAESMGITIETRTLAGKVYPQLHHYAAACNAGLVVVGRRGLHREPQSLIGSNALALARLTTSNLLVVSPPPEGAASPIPSASAESASIGWTPEAEQALKRVPGFVRRVVRKRVEDYARERQIAEITAETFQHVARLAGMGY